MEKWTFSGLAYERPDFDKIKQQLVEWTKAAKEAGTYEECRKIYLEADEALMPFQTQCTLAEIRNTLNTADAFYEEEMDYLNEQMPMLSPYSLAFSDVFYQSPFRPQFEEEFGHQMFEQIAMSKESFCEANIPLMQRENKLTTEYQKIMAGCAIEFQGEKRNLYGIRKFFKDPDREVRRQAFKAYSGFYKENETRLEEIWDELIRIRDEMGRNLGFENFIPLGYLQQSRRDYGPQEVKAFREQVKEVLVPLCEKLYEYQAKRLGLEQIMAWDEGMVFADGGAQAIGGDDFMIEKAREMYHEISRETGEFIDFMMDHELMDLKNKPNKASTGYMTYLPNLKAPFVFSCFNGTIGDMQVLSHEMGHAFAGYMAMREQPISDYYSEPTDIAEIHSMSMEQFCYPYAEKFFGEDADRYRFAHLQEALTFVPFGVAVDEFQHICYENPQLTPKERTWEWHKLEEKYMPWRRYEADDFFDRGGYWYHKLHIYLYPMYYINYTLTTMGAMEFKMKDAKDHESAWQDYLTLCKVGGSHGYLDTLRLANVTSPFEAGAVAKSVAYAQEILEAEMER